MKCGQKDYIVVLPLWLSTKDKTTLYKVLCVAMTADKQKLPIQICEIERLIQKGHSILCLHLTTNKLLGLNRGI